MNQDEIKKLHGGLIKCPLDEVEIWMPKIVPIIETCPAELNDDYYVDAKVHMLMPNQYPCIPNWHGDAIPRDENGLRPDLCDTSQKLYIWISGHPLPEFKDGRQVLPQTWIEFTQNDIHRGTMSKKHCWRLFIRLIPQKLVVRKRSGPECLRIHTQVYLDAARFEC